jgi:HEXXH motif-containing protein
MMALADVYACAGPNDPIQIAFLDRRRAAVPALLCPLASRLGTGQETLCAALTVYAGLSDEAQRAVVSAPMFGYWWLRLCQHYRAGAAGILADWVQQFSRFVLSGAMTHRMPVPGLWLPVGADGKVRIPGWDRSEAFSTMHVQAQYDPSTDLLVLRDGERRNVTAAVSHARSAGSAEEVTSLLADHDDPWITEYLESANANTQAQGGRGDVAAARVDRAESEAIRGTLDHLAEVWPAMRGEFDAIVRRIVPFESSETGAFSNSALDGVLFLRTDLADQLTAMERVVHETSHLRLNAVFALQPVHEHTRGERVHSPYREQMRPVDGLCHGAFVFARVAELLARAYRRTGERCYSTRLGQVLQLQTEALDIIDRQVRLTAVGQRLIADVRHATAAAAEAQS